MNLELSPVSSEQTYSICDALPSERTPESAPFRKVQDFRGHPIRGLWQRNQRFYAQFRVPGKKNATKVCLLDPSGAPARTLGEARHALHDLLKKRREHSLAVSSRTPTLGAYAQSYIQWLRGTQRKSPLTIAKEAGSLELWTARLGFVQLAHLQRAHINDFTIWRKESTQVSNRTINLDVIALSNCLWHAHDQGLIAMLPTQNWQPLPHRSPRRPLWSRGQIELICQKARERDMPQLGDYVLFLAYSGARRNEALGVQWSDVDFQRRLLALNITKYGRGRHVDLNARLQEHLKDMQTRRTESPWLFPAGWTADSPASAGTLQSRLEAVRAEAGMPDFCFHDLRHYFISACVMSGLDFMSIAKWVGHRDRGVLIGKVYGHLNDAHAQAMAAKLTNL